MNRTGRFTLQPNDQLLTIHWRSLDCLLPEPGLMPQSKKDIDWSNKNDSFEEHHNKFEIELLHVID